ncbi:hypothetical protein RvY_11892 [Ramazzottius varieornatus]|uniref:Fucosyltransferase n=1 Tax=Ramazzottius varieornatus TaxID=947166 RepID=A0A1D1VK11_RAMVA|nr:hypothetical protein RvY_11892 [Ramazzottius varieornatus]
MNRAVILMSNCGASSNRDEYIKQLQQFRKDYVSEKATRTYLTEVLPVMLGGANYCGIFPPHSFIDTADFESPRQLATYLWKLSRNLHLYEEYFDWKYEEQYLAIPEYTFVTGIGTVSVKEQWISDSEVDSWNEFAKSDMTN